MDENRKQKPTAYFEALCWLHGLILLALEQA